MFSRRVTSAMSRDRFLYSAISPIQFYCKYSSRDIKSYVICCLVSDYYDYVSSRCVSFLDLILYSFLYVVNRPIFVLREIVDLHTCSLPWPSSLYISRKLTIQYCFCLPVRSVSDLSRFLSRRVPPLVLARTTTRTSLISCIPSRRFPYSSRRFSSRRISSRRTSRVAHISRSRYLIRSIALFAILLIVTSSFVSITPLPCDS